MHLTIRADGGPEIGYGHLVRSGALAEKLLEQGHTVTVATTTPDAVREVFPTAVETVDLPSRDDPESFVAWLESARPDAAFTDAYPVDTAYQRAVRERVPLAVLQDDARHAVCADLFVNYNLHASTLDYEFVGRAPETCLGPAYVPLRREIRTRASDDPPWRDPPERAIVTMGGSDMARLTPTAVKAFDGFDLRVDTIVGPGCSDRQERAVRKSADAVSADVRVVRDPADLPERLFQADIAVSTASSTTYELLALGTPMVAVPVADNQRPIADALADRNLATVLRGHEGPAVADFRDAIEGYVDDSECRRDRRERGQNLVDGRGTWRLRAELLSLVGETDGV